LKKKWLGKARNGYQDGHNVWAEIYAKDLYQESIRRKRKMGIMSTQDPLLSDLIPPGKHSENDIQHLENQHDTSGLADTAAAQHMELASSMEAEDAKSRVDTEHSTPEERPQIEKEILALPMDHDGNAQAVVLKYDGTLLYCSAYQWLHYTNTYWERKDAQITVRSYVVKTLRDRQDLMMASCKDEEEREEARAKATRLACNRANTQEIMFHLEPRLAVPVESFDASLHHLNVQNGVLDLRTGAVEPHQATQRFTYCLPIPYLVDADRSVWTKFLQEVLDDQEIIDCLQTYIGYTLTGLTTLEKFVYLTGKHGRNGKGTFTQTLTKLLGEPLSKEVDFSTFTRNGAVTPITLTSRR
jgi:putative DNA primase/helicase